jgi:hypothetical protein
MSNLSSRSIICHSLFEHGDQLGLVKCTVPAVALSDLDNKPVNQSINLSLSMNTWKMRQTIEQQQQSQSMKNPLRVNIVDNLYQRCCAR